MTTTPRKHNPAWKDNTRNARQQKRRKLEKEWLAARGYTSWEALHTALMNGTIELNPIHQYREVYPHQMKDKQS